MKAKAAILIVALFPLLAGFDDSPSSSALNETGSRRLTLFPGGQLLYAPLASPKEPRTHVTWLLLNLAGPGGFVNLASVGFGDSFGLLRWAGWAQNDQWQLSVSGAVLAQFNLDSKSFDLINADYFIGIPLSYRNRNWGVRARIFHQSSHLGDEFLLTPQRPELRRTRINMSLETVELLGAWNWEGLQLTAGYSYILHTDTLLKRNAVQLGVDYVSTQIVYQATVSPYASVICMAWQETHWNPDVNAKAGINLRSPFAEKRSVQIYGEYHHGYLSFGQFYKLRADYYGSGLNVAF